MAEEALTETPQVSPEEQAAIDIGEQIAAEMQDNPPLEPSQEEPEAELPEDTGEPVEQEPTEEQAEEAGPELVEVEFNGQVIEAPKDVAEALMKDADYTQKTQEMSAERKQMEALRGEIEFTRQQYEFAASVQEDLRNAQIFEMQANDYRQMLRERVDNLSSTDIEKVRMQIDDILRQRDELVQSVSTKQAEFQQSQEQSRQELLKKGTEALRSKIPNWGEEQAQQVNAYGLSAGFTQEELNSVFDPRQVEVLWKAAQYDALKAGAKTTVSKVQAAPTIRPKGSNPMPAETRQKLDYTNKIKSKKLSAKAKAKEMERHFGEKFS